MASDYKVCLNCGCNDCTVDCYDSHKTQYCCHNTKCPQFGPWDYKTETFGTATGKPDKPWDPSRAVPSGHTPGATQAGSVAGQYPAAQSHVTLAGGGMTGMGPGNQMQSGPFGMPVSRTVPQYMPQYGYPTQTSYIGPPPMSMPVYPPCLPSAPLRTAAAPAPSGPPAPPPPAPVTAVASPSPTPSSRPTSPRAAGKAAPSPRVPVPGLPQDNGKPITYIMPGLYLGDKRCLEDPSILSKHSITAIISCVRESELTDPMKDSIKTFANKNTHKVKVSDKPWSDILTTFYDACLFIDDHLRPEYRYGKLPSEDEQQKSQSTTKNRRQSITEFTDSEDDDYTAKREQRTAAPPRVLVHCMQGISRAPAVILAYILWRHKDETLGPALEKLRYARPCVSPNIGFLDQLTVWTSVKEFVVWHRVAEEDSDEFVRDPLYEDLRGRLKVYKRLHGLERVCGFQLRVDYNDVDGGEGRRVDAVDAVE